MLRSAASRPPDFIPVVPPRSSTDFLQMRCMGHSQCMGTGGLQPAVPHPCICCRDRQAHPFQIEVTSGEGLQGYNFRCGLRARASTFLWDPVFLVQEHTADLLYKDQYGLVTYMPTLRVLHSLDPLLCLSQDQLAWREPPLHPAGRGRSGRERRARAVRAVRKHCTKLWRPRVPRVAGLAC